MSTKGLFSPTSGSTPVSAPLKQDQHLQSDYHLQVCIPHLQQQAQQHNDSGFVESSSAGIEPTSASTTAGETTPTQQHTSHNAVVTPTRTAAPLSHIPSPSHASHTDRLNSISTYCASPVHRNKGGEVLCCVHSDCCQIAGYQFYFAIGSMCNPTSLKLRGVTPVESHPAILRGWRIAFDGLAGMANVMEDPTAHFHGVLHRVTDAEMKILDVIEGSYYRLPVDVELYDGRKQKATVYKMEEDKLDRTRPAGLPSERYLDIISRGLKHFNADPEYIKWIQAQPCIPRKSATDYAQLSLPCDHAKCRIYTLSELSQYDGKDGRDTYIGVNGKVLKFVGDMSDPAVYRNYEYIKDRYAGTDITFRMSRVLYEPIYRIATCPHEMDPSHKAWVENMLAERAGMTNQQVWECVGLLEDTICTLHDHHKLPHLANEQKQQESGTADKLGENSRITTSVQTVHYSKGRDVEFVQRSSISATPTASPHQQQTSPL